ncbi:hypothetical protein POREN0001_1500 [Porphyromonas endodontalis ATCC 35406]|uniref:Uncharacterized protein n=1 Tax=Porphyromonas endodontalis (strain ATCC 35406 / DSM 24491 / JCM 8526 / CCUG 16442 / BCRC 14492 / NCTC 13058 / HG 370) TaxID=553175 RepID=C3JB57_POREA|nr:hypothetical protein POREN0001_1500 [Porphyromonas endodontalis ATCC 35406]
MLSPVIVDYFANKNGFDNLKETIEANYKRVKADFFSRFR